MSNIEILQDKNSAVNIEGDVVPVDDVADDRAFEIYGSMEVKPGASVKLGERALALAQIMDAYNKKSKLGGAVNSRVVADFDNRYGSRADDVIGGMMNKARVASRRTGGSMAILNADDELLKAGFSDAQVVFSKRKIKSELDDKFGPGISSAPLRAKAVRRAEKSANNI